MTASPRLTIGVTLASAVVIVALVASASQAGPTLGRIATWVPLLAAAGLLCLVGLTLRERATIAWPAAVVAAWLATLEPIRIGRSLESGGVPVAEGWVVAAVVVTFCALGTTIVAALHVTRPEARIGGWVVPVAVALTAWLGAACCLAIWLTLTGHRADDSLTPARVVTRALTLPIDRWPFLIAGLLTLGIVGDILPAAGQARRRRAAGEGRTGPVGLVELVADELLGGPRVRQAAAEVERTRLASDLHAEVLPTVRQALDDLETGRPGSDVAATLREVADRLDGVVRDRRDVVLEQLGLIAALEALAERTQDRAGLIVDLVVEGPGPPVSDGATALPGTPTTLDGRPPRAVEAAAHRIVGLALDNVRLHGDASAVEIHAAVDHDSVVVTVQADGRSIGPEDEARALRDGRQGLAEMRRLAADTAGELEIGPRPGGGSVVAYRWPG